MKELNILVPIRHPVGGIRTYLKYTYPKLKKYNYWVTILSIDNKELSQFQKDLGKICKEIISIKSDDSLFVFVKKIYSTIATKKYNLIHSQGFTAGLATVIANLWHNIPHIMTSHDILRKNQFEGYKGWIKLELLSMILQRIDIIQSVSHDAQNNLIEYIPRLRNCKEKLKVIHNGIDLDHFTNPAINDLDKEKYERNNLFKIGFIGRYMPQKGFLDLVEVVDILKKKYNDLKFSVFAVGRFSAFIREYKKEIKKGGLDGYFEFIDFQENINYIMREIDILVMPSYWEACPILPMEALVCGTPCIAYSCTGLREVLKDTPAIMINVGDKKNMASEIINVWSNYTQVKKVFNDYIPKAKKRFEIKKCAVELENILIYLMQKTEKIAEKEF